MKCENFLNKILFSVTISLLLAGQLFAQDRPRLVVGERNAKKTEVFRESQPVSKTPNPATRPVLTNSIRVIGNTNPEVLVKKTVSSVPTNSPINNFLTNKSLAAFNQRLRGAMDSKIGIPYHYGSDGPRTYDCSGLIWSVFGSAGMEFSRTSARTYWNTFEPAYGDERYKFGTLVFFNSLGHVGIVIDENTFYHASSSKGVTYSPFSGYWGKRVVGFRRIPMNF